MKLAEPLFSPLQPCSDYPDAYDFITPDGTTFIRVRYQDATVRNLEFSAGANNCTRSRVPRTLDKFNDDCLGTVNGTTSIAKTDLRGTRNRVNRVADDEFAMVRLALHQT